MLPQNFYNTNPYMSLYGNSNANAFMQQRQEVVRVNGKNGAEAYQLPPNSSILLMDQTAPIVWLKKTDGASYPTIAGYNIVPINDAATSSNDYSDLESRISKLERIIQNGQSNVGNSQPNTSSAIPSKYESQFQ